MELKFVENFTNLKALGSGALNVVTFLKIHNLGQEWLNQNFWNFKQKYYEALRFDKKINQSPG